MVAYFVGIGGAGERCETGGWWMYVGVWDSLVECEREG